MVLIVGPPKRVDLLLRVVDGREPMHVQAFFPEPTVERFDGRIVRGPAATAEVEYDAVRVRPPVHRGADELTAVIAVDALRQAPLEAQTRQRRDDIPATEPVPDVDRQALAGEEVGRSPLERGIVAH